jgi:hypothetical protein
MKIHTLGDSHCYFGWDDSVKVHGVGPILAYSVANGRLDTIDILSLELNDNDTLIFSFGEIDCRCHIYKYVNLNNTYQSVIETIVDKYLEAVQNFIKKCNKKIRVGIYNVIPPKKIATGDNPEFPFLGTSEERLQFTRYFNKCIKSTVEKYNFMYINILDKYTDEEGYLIPELADNSVHIANGEELMKYINTVIRVDM